MNYDLTTPDGLKAYMSEATSESDWNIRLDEVKRANNNDYPPFWFPVIVLGQVAAKTAAKWGGSDKLKIFNLDL